MDLSVFPVAVLIKTTTNIWLYNVIQMKTMGLLTGGCCIVHPFLWCIIPLFQGFSVLAVLTFGTRQFCGGGCPVPYGMFMDVPGLHPQMPVVVPFPRTDHQKCLQILPKSCLRSPNNWNLKETLQRTLLESLGYVGVPTMLPCLAPHTTAAPLSATTKDDSALL